MTTPLAASLLSLVLAGTAAPPVVPPVGPHSVSEGTPIKVRSVRELDSARDHKGDSVPFEVAADIKNAAGETLIHKGAAVIGTITKANGKNCWGKAGRLEFRMDSIKLSDTFAIPLKSKSLSAKGGGNDAAAWGAVIAFGFLGGLVKGKNAHVPVGREYTALVAKTVEVPVSVASLRPLDPLHLSLIRCKDGRTISGTILEMKQFSYIVATDLGELTIPQEKVESVVEQPKPTDEQKKETPPVSP